MERRILLIALMALTPFVGSAQDDKIDEVTGRASTKAERRADQKLDQGIDSGLDKLEGVLFGGNKNKKKKSEGDADPEENNNSSSTAPTEDRSSEGQMKPVENDTPFEPTGLVGSYRSEIHSYKNGKEEKGSPTNVRIAFSDDRIAMIPETGDAQKDGSRMIFDLKNKHTYTLVTDENGERTGIKMRSMAVDMSGAPESDAPDPRITRTNETRMINGHECRRYLFKDESGEGDAWIAEGLDFNVMKAFSQLTGFAMMKEQRQMPFKSMMMESTWNDTNGKDKVTMFTRDLEIGKVDESMFSTSGYRIQDMTAMPMFGQ